MITNGPADARLGDYMKAVEKHAKLQSLAAALPARLAEAEREVAIEAEKLGITLPRAPKVAKAARSGNGAPPQGSIAQSLLDALPGTSAELRERTGLESGQVSGGLNGLKERGLVAKGDDYPATWSRAG